MRLVFVSVARPPLQEERAAIPDPSLAPPQRRVQRPSVTLSSLEPPAIQLVSPPVRLAGADAAAITGAHDLQQPGGPWAGGQAAPAFQLHPLRSRRALSPGGERPGAFMMKAPMRPARVLVTVAGAFGDNDHCPNIRSRVYGVLSSTSDRDRALLQELRRDRQYCRP